MYYYIESPWDLQWIAANNDIVDYITNNMIQPTHTYEGYNFYEVNIVGKNHKVLHATPDYITTINRLTDYYYIVEVKINNRYVLAREHQRNALIKYVMTQESNVCIPHIDGGDFNAVFKTIDDNNFEYKTEYGNTVEIRRTVML
jgi:hypothetical protein